MFVNMLCVAAGLVSFVSSEFSQSRKDLQEATRPSLARAVKPLGHPHFGIDGEHAGVLDAAGLVRLPQVKPSCQVSVEKWMQVLHHT